MSDNQAFLEDVNSSEKKLGHNMLQVEIIALQKEIDHWKTSDNEKEMKLGLFKKTIANLQAQLQERTTRIESLEANMNGQINVNSQEKLESKTIIEDCKVEMDKLRQDLDAAHKKHIDDEKMIQSLQHECQELQGSLNTAQNTLSSIHSSFDSQTKQIEAYIQNNKQLQTQLDLNSSISDNLTIELEALKNELAGYKSRNEKLQSSLEETIQQLQEQLERKQSSEPKKDDDAKPPQVYGYPRTTRERRKR
jgi:predicted  nucleic acid-binding Zn-ribbon protein